MQELNQVLLIPRKPPHIATNQTTNEAALSILSFKDKLVEDEHDSSISMIIDTNVQSTPGLQNFGQDNHLIHSSNERTTSSTVSKGFSKNLPSMEILDYNQASKESDPTSSP